AGGGEVEAVAVVPPTGVADHAGAVPSTVPPAGRPRERAVLGHRRRLLLPLRARQRSPARPSPRAVRATRVSRAAPARPPAPLTRIAGSGEGRGGCLGRPGVEPAGRDGRAPGPGPGPLDPGGVVVRGRAGGGAPLALQPGGQGVPAVSAGQVDAPSFGVGGV